MKNKINNWAHRNLAEIIITIVFLVLVDIGVSVYNLQDRRMFAEASLKNQDSIKAAQLVNRENASRGAASLRQKLDSINAIKK